MPGLPRGVAGGAADGGAVMGLLNAGPMVTDDAGKAVRLLDRAKMCEWPSSGDARMQALVARMRVLLSREDSRTRVLAYALVACWMGAFYALSYYLPVVMQYGGGEIFVLIIPVTMALVWRSRLRASARPFVELLLEEGLCPCCGGNFAGQDLGRIPAEDVVTCLKCGSKWFRHRIVHAEAFSPAAKMARPSTLIRGWAMGQDLWKTTDDAGDPARLVDPHLAEALRGASTPEHRERLEIARAATLRHRRWLRAMVAAVLFVGGVTLVAAAIVVGQHLGWFLTGSSICIGLACGAWFGNFAYSPVYVRLVMLEHDLCPSCGADLRGFPATPERGVVRCAACRAAWRVARPTEAP